MLNRDQQRAVDTASHCMVIACPGSGKTRVIVRKAAFILRTVPASRICCVTFTRDAAREIKHRLTTELRGTGAAPIVGTFHSLAMRQLQKAERLSKLIKPSQQEAFVHRALDTTGVEVTYQKAVEIIEACKGSLTYVPGDDAAGALYGAYMALMERNKVVDFFDVMTSSVRLMRSGQVAPVPATHLLIDEFQDTDEVQMAWTMEHVKNGATVTVVGDDDQTIFAWRRALGYPGMMEFARATNAAKVTLNINYRSREEILDAANRLISQNASRVEKRLLAHKGRGGAIGISRMATRDDEADAVVEEIARDALPLPGHARYQRTVPCERWAVLARTNRLLRSVAASLEVAGIQYRIGVADLWGEAPVVFMLALLRSAQTGDRDGIDQVLRWAGVSKGTLTRLHEHYGAAFPGLLHGGAKVLPEDVASNEVKIIDTLMKLGPQWRANIDIGRINLTVHAVKAWMQAYLTEQDDNHLLEIAAKVLMRLQGSLLARITALSTPAADDRQDGVRLLTMHSCKGLEFEKVWIIGAEAGVIPNGKSDTEEERRLMYVAMTRARERLQISSCMENPPSGFLSEVGI